jgi:hypothetical protein
MKQTPQIKEKNRMVDTFESIAISGDKQTVLQEKPGINNEGNTSFLFNYRSYLVRNKKRIGIKLGKSLIVKSLYQVIFIALTMMLITSCARNTSFLNSSVVPAAQGTVKVKTDKNKNYVIQVQIKDLADASRLTPAKQNYVVWMETDQGRLENLGNLKSSKSFMSKQMSAKLETVSSFKPIKVFVTAENDANVQYPDRLVVLSTDNF